MCLGAYGIVLLVRGTEEPAASSAGAAGRPVPDAVHALKVVTLLEVYWNVFDNANRIYREIELLRQLKHANLVNLTGLFVEWCVTHSPVRALCSL
jgi:hypothetical protein